jgi:hypothetical protein
MAITHFIPEVWSAALLSILDKSLVFAGVSNRNYEGDISAFGDTVHIVDLADPTITPYTRNTNLSDPENLTDDEQLLVIDQANSFNFQLDDLDAAQARSGGALMNEAARRAAFGLRDEADQHLAGKMAIAAGNALGVVDATTASNVYDKLLVPASVALDEQNVPEEMRWIVLPPAAYGKLQLDDRFIKAAYSGNAALHNGVVGEAAGFQIYKSNNSFQANRTVASVTTASGAKTLTAVAGAFNQGDVGLSVTGTGVGASAKVVSVNADGSVATVDVNSSASAAVTVTLAGGGQLAYAGSRIATTYAEQILKTVAYSPEKRFGDALKGLHVFGSKVVRPEALAVASVKTS